MVPTPRQVSQTAMALPSWTLSTWKLARVRAAGGTADSPTAATTLRSRERRKKAWLPWTSDSQPDSTLPRPQMAGQGWEIA